MRWSGATGAIARCKRVSTGCGRKRRSVPAWPWICGVKPTPKAVNKPSPHFIVHGLDKPGGFTTVSQKVVLAIAVGGVGKLRANRLHERILLVRHPPPNGLGQALGPLTGQGDHTLHLYRGARQEGLRKPHPLAPQLADHV